MTNYSMHKLLAYVLGLYGMQRPKLYKLPLFGHLSVRCVNILRMLEVWISECPIQACASPVLLILMEVFGLWSAD